MQILTNDDAEYTRPLSAVVVQCMNGPALNKDIAGLQSNLFIVV